MSFFGGLMARMRKSSSMSTFEGYEALLARLAGRSTRSGRSVNFQNAIEVATVLCCARVLAEGVAQVPWKLFLDSSHQAATSHPLHRIIHRRPNEWQTSFEFREQMMLHLTLCQGAFAYKNDVLGGIQEMFLFQPQDVTVKRDSAGTLLYSVRAKDGTTQEFPASAIWHVRGPSWDGVNGLEIVKLAREAIGLAMATEEQHARLFQRGVTTNGVYSVEGKLNETQHKALRGWIAQHYVGDENRGAPLILDNSAKWLPVTLSGVDAQHLETRRFQIEEICRFFRVMPIMVGFADKTATYASAEQMFLAHVVHTLSPWYERIEQSADVNLLSPKDQAAGYYTKFVEEGLLRASTEATAIMLDKYVNGGIMTPNEARAKLDMPPDSDPASSKLRVPANIVGKAPAKDPATDPANEGAKP